MPWLKSWPARAAQGGAERRRAPKLQSQLTVTALEQRDNPSAPDGLLDVPLLYWNASSTSGYTETHEITRSFTHTITLDQSGDGTEGTFVLDITGEAHAEDAVSGSGGYVTATGTLTTDVNYHIVVAGQYSGGAFTVTSESYTETGSTASTYNISVGSFWYPNPTPTHYTSFDGDSTETWSMAWSGTVTDGELSFTSFSYEDSFETNRHTRTSYPGGVYIDDHVNVGSKVTESGSGTTATYDGEAWRVEHYLTHTPSADYPSDSTSDDRESGTVDLDTTPLEYDLTWNAVEPTAVNYAWHGESALSGTLTETATWTVGQLDVNSYASGSHYRDQEHVIEDEPDVPDSGTGTENYHRDEAYVFTDDTTGSGSYVDDTADADFHSVWAGTFAVHNVLTVEGDHETGVDEDGYPYDLVFNYVSDRTAGGSGSITSDYHDGDDGIELTGVTYGLSGGTTTEFHHWGTRNGVGYDTTNTTGESLGISLTLPGDPGPISGAGLGEAYPFAGQGSGVFLVRFDPPIPPTTPPGIPGIPNPAGGLRTGAGGLQGWYNQQVRRIGKDAEKKVVKDLVVRPMVLQAIQDTVPGGGVFPKAGGQISLEGKGYTIAIGLQRKKDLDKAVEQRIEYMKGVLGYENVKLVSADFEAGYAVDQANQNPRSGKCVISYQIDLKFSATKNKVQVNPVRDGIQGVFEFYDEKLERMALRLP